MYISLFISYCKSDWTTPGDQANPHTYQCRKSSLMNIICTPTQGSFTSHPREGIIKAFFSPLNDHLPQSESNPQLDSSKSTRYLSHQDEP